MSFRKSHPLIKFLNGSFIDLPTPVNLSVNWNYGSILFLILLIQLVSGILLATRYSAHVSIAFSSVVSITQDSNYGWLLRLVHSTGASFFFLFLYLHIGRGIYYGSYTRQVLWNLGVTIYLVLMGTAFLGYVLPWGQMSYWAATVITNLLSAIPLFGSLIVEWVWGGFAVANPTLTRFFSLHYLLPFIVVALSLLHVYYLHLSGSSNPLGVDSSVSKVSFHYYYSVKDLLLYLIFFLVFMIFTCLWGYNFMDPENFIPANILVTPIHIQPEWYFLFAYAILRAIPNKLGGVLALLAAVLVLYGFSINSKNLMFVGFNNSVFSRLLFWFLVSDFFCLTWLGSCPAEPPFITVSLVCSVIYFFLMLLMISLSHINSKLYTI